MSIERFEEIEAWQLARKLTNSVYRIWKSNGAPRDYGLQDQMLRAAGSVMHNIAEGFDAGGNPEFIRFLGYAKRSCTEVQSQLYLALDERYIDQQKFDRLYEAARLTRAKIGAFIRYLEKSSVPAAKRGTKLRRLPYSET